MLSGTWSSASEPHLAMELEPYIRRFAEFHFLLYLMIKMVLGSVSWSCSHPEGAGGWSAPSAGHSQTFPPTRTNIPGNRVAEGQETCPYLQPFPARGSGFHRFAFLLFKQDKPIDFSEDTRPSPCYQLAQRTFHTFDFYKKHQEAMTPAGLAFFQCRWDDSVTHVFHQLLDMREPVFEFVRPSPYHPKQKRFPHRQPLRYLDRYRDSHEPTYGIY